MKRVKRASHLDPLEKDIQKAIVEYLKLRGIVYSLTDASRAFGKDGFPRRSKVTPDWPDLSAVIPMQLEMPDGTGRPIGVGFFIEVKSKKGPIRPGQKERLLQLRATGAIAIVARSVEDVKVILDKYLNRSLSVLAEEALEPFPWEEKYLASLVPVVSDKVQQLVAARRSRRSA